MKEEKPKYNSSYFEIKLLFVFGISYYQKRYKKKDFGFDGFQWIVIIPFISIMQFEYTNESKQ